MPAKRTNTSSGGRAGPSGSAPAHLIIGEDSYLQVEALNSIVRAMGNDIQRTEFDGETARLEDVLDELRSYSMFGSGGRVVVIRNADDFITRHRARLDDYLASPSPTGTLVLRVKAEPKNTRLFKQIEKLGQIHHCDPPTGQALARWIGNRASQGHRISLRPDAVQLLAELIGPDLGRLDNELAKLALDDPKQQVGADAVTRIVAFQRDLDLPEMSRAVAEGRVADAMRLWRRLVDANPGVTFGAPAFLSNWLADVGVVLGGGNTSRISWKYRDGFTDFVNAAQTMGRVRYRRAVNLLASLEQRAKSGLGEADINIERFIASLQ